MRKFYRSALFTLLVAATMAAVSCGKDDTGGKTPVKPPVENTDKVISEWMFDIMGKNYLWNVAVKKVTPDYTLGYEEFLQRVLLDVAAQNNVNRDDGHWEDGRRSYFYSNVQRYKASVASMSTRGTHLRTEGTGIEFMVYGGLGNKGDLYLQLLAVAPESPAEKAGLMRGTYITQVDGAAITRTNLEAVVEALTPNEAGRTVKITTATETDGKLKENPEITVVSAEFDDNPVWVHRVLEPEDGRKIGYLVYNAFNSNFDHQLMEAFKEFKSRSVDELVLDLRYNGGGHVVSSALMGSMIAGAAKKGQIYAKLTYNADRTAKGASTEYRIGEKYDGYYTEAVDGVGADYALDLSRIYVLCSGNTASASELVVNGLQGLDLDVRLIGVRTNGKNVGMEVETKTRDGYTYEFSPITFYSANAKNFKDYSEGFVPAVEVEETAHAVCNWGDMQDPLLAVALKWIETGTEPAAPAAQAVRSAMAERKVFKRRGRLEGSIVVHPERE